jgi:Uma2 family endonuclease
MGMAAPIFYTADIVRALPEDGNKYEVVHGELLVTPAPRPWHEEVWGRLFIRLREYLDRERVGHLFGSRSDISWGPDTLVSPDLIVVPLEDARTLDWTRMQHLLLVAEVLSPSSMRHDRFTKRRLYQEQGISVYWVIDGEHRAVEVWEPGALFPQVEIERLRWDPAGATEPFMLCLHELFRPI